MAEFDIKKRIERVAGADLAYGEFRTENFSDDELWAALCGAFSSKASHSTSYKYAFMKAILDNLYNVDENYGLTFEQLFSKFAEVYWNLILTYQIRQMPKTKGDKNSLIERVLWDARDRYELTEGIPFESLSEEQRQAIGYQVRMKCKNNVVGALYGDTMRLFYSFDRKEQWLKLNPAMYEFLCKHKVFVEKVNYFEWARYLEKINDGENTIHLLTKLDESAKRQNLNPFRQVLYNEFESRRCFYCGKPLNIDNTHVDHFVPWSFIKDDKLWNFVIACPECNERKKDKLPIVPYLDVVEDRNVQLFRRGFSFGMENYKPERLRKVYSWAQNNGYDELWKPSKQWLYPRAEDVIGLQKVAEEVSGYNL